MEAVGAVVSIVQIAHFGVQLSLKLYKLAEAIGAASKDVQYVAKDIALFSTVLKDLGNTLQRGQESRLYRDDAYQTGRLIFKECEEVFNNIQQILKKSGVDEITDTISIGRKEKFLWMFHKSRVQILRGNLESLKSTILLQVAVLSYADTVSSSLNPATNGDDFLALKSLVLADETIKGALEKLKLSEGSSVENPNSLPDDATNVVNSESNQSAFTQSTTIKPSRRSQPPSSMPNTPFDPKSYLEIWNRVDRLELALRNIETAKWEYKRLWTNMTKVKQGSRIYQNGAEEKEERANISRVKTLLSEFGLSEEKLRQALASVVIYGPSADMRTQTKYSVPQNDTLFATLQHFGASWEPDKERHNFWNIKRWMPYYLEDILWEHTSQLIMRAMGAKRETPARVPQNISEFDSASSAQEHSQNLVQQAILYIQQFDADPNRIRSFQSPQFQLSLVNQQPKSNIYSVAQKEISQDMSRSSNISILSPLPPPATERLWSSKDDSSLMLARGKGLDWKPIASEHPPTKPTNSNRKRHERLIEKKNSAYSWDVSNVERLADAYINCREEMWNILGGRVGEKWQDVESKVQIMQCMKIGLVMLQKPSQTYARQKLAHDIDDVANDETSFSDNYDDIANARSYQPHSSEKAQETMTHRRPPVEPPSSPKKLTHTSASIPSIVVDFSPDLTPREKPRSFFPASIPETNRMPPPSWTPAGAKPPSSSSALTATHSHHSGARNNPARQRSMLHAHRANRQNTRDSFDTHPSLGKRKTPPETSPSFTQRTPSTRLHVAGYEQDHRASMQAQTGDRISDIVRDLLRRWTFLDDSLVQGLPYGPPYRAAGEEVRDGREGKRLKGS